MVVMVRFESWEIALSLNIFSVKLLLQLICNLKRFEQAKTAGSPPILLSIRNTVTFGCSRTYAGMIVFEHRLIGSLY